MILSGNGRLMNLCGANFPMLPIKRARPRTAVPIFFITAIVEQTNRANYAVHGRSS